MFQLPDAIKHHVRILAFISLSSMAAAAQTTGYVPLISLVQSSQTSATASSAAQFAAFPRTSVSTQGGSVRTIQFRLNDSLTITKLSFAPSQGGKQEFKVLGASGCNTDGSYANLPGTVCSATVQFTPAYAGVRTVPLNVTTNRGVIPLGVTGTGVAPIAALTPGIISTVAGNGTNAYAGDGGPATSASLGNPYATAIDSAGNLYIAVNGSFSTDIGYFIRKVDATTGTISTIAGTGTYGDTGDGGPAANATLGSIIEMKLGPDGALYIASGTDTDSSVRRVDLGTGIITRVAGNGSYSYSGDGGSAATAGINSVQGLAFDSAGNLYLADAGNYRIRKIDVSTGIINTFAGTGVAGTITDGSLATATPLSARHVAVDPSGNVYFTGDDTKVHKIDAATQVVSTFAGSDNGDYGRYSGDGGPATSASFGTGSALASDAAGQIYIIDSNSSTIHKVDTSGIFSTIAGNQPAQGISQGAFSGDGGVATAAKLNFPESLSIDSEGNLYIADENNFRIRKISSSTSALTFSTDTVTGMTDTTDGPLSVMLTNIGNAPLTFASSSSDANPLISTPDFTYSTSSSCPQIAAAGDSKTLTAGASCILAAEFTPAQPGPRTANLVVTNDSANTAGSQQTVALSGSASASNADLTSTSVTSFGTTRYVSGQPVNLSASIADATHAATLPTGTVIFMVYQGSSVIATSTPVIAAGGIATWAYTPSTTGTLTVKAAFTSADPSTWQSSADATGQSMTVVGDFTLMLSGNSISQNAGITAAIDGAPAVFDVNLTPGTGGYPSDVKLSISGLPSEAVISISPASIAQDGGASTAHITVNISKVTLTALHHTDSPFGGGDIAFAGVFLLGGLTWRKRRLGVSLMLAILLTAVTTLSGCVQRTNAALNSYDLVVTATSGSVQHTATIKFSISR